MDIIKICVNVSRNSVLYFLSGHLVRSNVRHAINFHFLFFTSIRNSFQNFSQFQTLPITKNVVLESDSREIFSYKYIYTHIHTYIRVTHSTRFTINQQRIAWNDVRSRSNNDAPPPAKNRPIHPSRLASTKPLRRTKPYRIGATLTGWKLERNNLAWGLAFLPSRNLLSLSKKRSLSRKKRKKKTRRQ